MSLDIKMESKTNLKFWDQLMERSYRLDQVTVEAGYFSEEIHEDSGINIGALARIHNYGSVKANIPARDFMTLGGVFWGFERQVFSKAFVDYCLRRKSLALSMTPVGRAGSRNIKRSINSQQFVPLKPETIAKKGSSTILVDTGELLRKPKWRVGMK